MKIIIAVILAVIVISIPSVVLAMQKVELPQIPYKPIQLQPHFMELYFPKEMIMPVF